MYEKYHHVTMENKIRLIIIFFGYYFDSVKFMLYLYSAKYY